VGLDRDILSSLGETLRKKHGTELDRALPDELERLCAEMRLMAVKGEGRASSEADADRPLTRRSPALTRSP
jgi:hypothetical protein